MNGAERIRLIGMWVLLGPMVGGSVVGLVLLVYALITDPGGMTSPQGVFAVGFWACAALAVAWIFGTWLVRETREVFRSARERERRRCCPGCGYYLRGNVSGVCPECGRHVKRDRKALEHQRELSNHDTTDGG